MLWLIVECSVGCDLNINHQSCEIGFYTWHVCKVSPSASFLSLIKNALRGKISQEKKKNLFPSHHRKCQSCWNKFRSNFSWWCVPLCEVNRWKSSVAFDPLAKRGNHPSCCLSQSLRSWIIMRSCQRWGSVSRGKVGSHSLHGDLITRLRVVICQ